jgi:hypothetical protein
MTRRFACFALLAVISVACAKPRVDVSSDDTMKQSLQRVRASLSEGRRPAFDAALTTIFASTFDFGKMMAGSTGVASMESSVKQAIQKKTGEEIIAYAESLKKEREAKEREQALGEIKELEEKQEKAGQARQHLSSFRVVRSRFYKTTQGFLSNQPVIELTVANGTGKPVSRAYFKGTLSSPGRSVPWLREDFNHSIPGGLEAAESATWHLSPNMFSAWGSVDAPRDAVLTVEVVRLDGADGQPLFGSESFSDTDVARLKELKAKFKP